MEIVSKRFTFSNLKLKNITFKKILTNFENRL
ncbi:hypothetical protein ACFW04_003726 [Cataglyphis niger]